MINKQVMSKSEILESAMSIAMSPSFIEDNYYVDGYGVDYETLIQDTIDYIAEELEDYGIEYTESEIVEFVSKINI